MIEAVARVIRGGQRGTGNAAKSREREKGPSKYWNVGRLIPLVRTVEVTILEYALFWTSSPPHIEVRAFGDNGDLQENPE